MRMSSYISTGVACLPVIGPIVSAFYPFCSDATILKKFDPKVKRPEFNTYVSQLLEKRREFTLQVRDILFNELQAVKDDVIRDKERFPALGGNVPAICAVAQRI
jgi:hypothetical protein